MFLTDSLPPEIERDRRTLVERRNRLRAMLVGDPADRELRDEIEKVEREIKRLDTGSASSA